MNSENHQGFKGQWLNKLKGQFLFILISFLYNIKKNRVDGIYLKLFLKGRLTHSLLLFMSISYTINLSGNIIFGQAIIEFPFEENHFKRTTLKLLGMLASRRFISPVKILGVFISNSGPLAKTLSR